MFNSESFGFAIARPLAEVYEFLLDPVNYGLWAFVDEAPMRHLGGRDWAVDTPVGPCVIRFAERNRFGVLDHHILRGQDERPHLVGMRVVANGAGTELIYTLFRRPTVDRLEWGSMKEWVVTDLLALQSMLDGRGAIGPLLASRTVALSIARPPGEVHEFLLRPANFAKWVFAGDARLTSLGGDQWAIETSVGPRIMQFSKPNSFGILDYTSRTEIGGPPLSIPMRVMPNGDGTELTLTFLQRPGTTDEQWSSLREWVFADLLALKSMLELERE